MYVVRVPLQGGSVERTCDHQSIKEFPSIKNKMTITPVIYCRVNIYGRYAEMPGTFYTVISLLASSSSIQQLSFSVSQYLAIRISTEIQNFRFQECFNIKMFAKS